MARRLILHAGQHKTGSTSIQAYLEANRASLAALGTGVCADTAPDLAPAPAPFSANCKFIANALVRPALVTPVRARNLCRALPRDVALRRLRAVNARLRAMPEETVILSAEALSFLRKPQEMERLDTLCDGLDWHCIMFLREPAHWLESWKAQLARTGLATHPALTPGTGILDTRPESWLVDHEAIRTFWNGRATFASYEDTMATHRSVIPVCLAATGLDPLRCPPWDDFFLNRSTMETPAGGRHDLSPTGQSSSIKYKECRAMPLTDRKVLTFDVVGTLIDFETGILDYLRDKASGLNISDQTLLEAYAVAEDNQHHLTPRLPFPSMLAPMYREMAEKLGLPASEDDVQGFRLSIPRWPAFPDSIAALKRLRKHFKLVAMTNSDNWALSHFAATLDNPFDDLVTAEMVGWNKPDPQVFAYVRGRLSRDGFGFDDILHVAQSQYHDIAVAKALGYHTCWIQRRKGKTGAGATPQTEKVIIPEYHFGALAELADAVEAGA